MRRRWARPLALAILWAWVVLGQPLLFVLFFMTASVKSFSTAGGVAFIVLLSLSYLALPWLGIRFYQGKHVQGTFEAHDPGPSAVDARPVAILVLCLLDLFFLAALQVPLLFSGLFPLFGMLQSGMAGFYLVDASVLVLAVLLWGTWKRRGWALEGSAAYYVLLAAAWIATFARTPYAELLTWLRLPPTEIEMLSGTPLRGWEIRVFVGLPMPVCAAVAVACRRSPGSLDHERRGAEH